MRIRLGHTPLRRAIDRMSPGMKAAAEQAIAAGTATEDQIGQHGKPQWERHQGARERERRRKQLERDAAKAADWMQK